LLLFRQHTACEYKTPDSKADQTQAGIAGKTSRDIKDLPGLFRHDKK